MQSKRKRKILEPQIVDGIVEAIFAKESPKEIAIKFGVHVSTIFYYKNIFVNGKKSGKY